MNETDIQAIMIDNKTINQRIENSLNVIFADIDITAAQGRVYCKFPRKRYIRRRPA